MKFVKANLYNDFGHYRIEYPTKNTNEQTATELKRINADLVELLEGFCDGALKREFCHFSVDFTIDDVPVWVIQFKRPKTDRWYTLSDDGWDNPIIFHSEDEAYEGMQKELREDAKMDQVGEFVYRVIKKEED